MSNFDVIAMALKNLFKRKLRTFLTILGVIIGTASIVVMISLGLAINKNFDSQLSKISDITLIHVVGVDQSSSASQNKKNKLKMDDTAVYNFKQIAGVDFVSPIINMSYDIKAISGKYSATLSLVGISAEFFKQLGYELGRGRFLNEDDKLNIVCGGKVPFSFEKNNNRRRYYYGGSDDKEKTPDVDVMKDRITISVDRNYGNIDTTGETSSDSTTKAKAYPVKFVGVLKYNDASYNESDYNCYMTIEQVKKLKAEKQKFDKSSGSSSSNNFYGNNNNADGYSEIYIKCKNMDVVKKVAEKVKDMGYNAYYAGQYLDSMKATSANMQALLGAIGAVSLFVAAIGIANTMIMSVYERTREIGIMKVIGASIRDIRKLFLLESSTIGFLGGILGALFSLAVSYFLNTAKISFFNTDSYMYMDSGAQKPAVSLIPWWLCVAAVIFSGLVGLISGYFPARRATKLSALMAIKSE